ncbi:MAG: hypothetical protein WBP81_06360, partial [Solirubrobacteraceae bacterium]
WYEAFGSQQVQVVIIQDAKKPSGYELALISTDRPWATQPDPGHGVGTTGPRERFRVGGGRRHDQDLTTASPG